MDIRYFERWVRAKKAPVLPLDTAQAMLRNEQNEPYVAVISIDKTPSCVVDFASNWVSVCFLNKLGNIYLTYDFKKTDKTMMFLSTAIYREYNEDTGKILTSTTFSFSEDGKILIEKRDHVNSVVEQKESHGDPAANWEPSPRFGDYTSLCRTVRE